MSKTNVCKYGSPKHDSLHLDTNQGKRVFPPVHMCVLTLLGTEHAPSIVLWLELHQFWASQHLYNKSPADSCRCYITQQGFADAKHRAACIWGLTRGQKRVDSSSTRVALWRTGVIRSALQWRKTVIKYVAQDHKRHPWEEINILWFLFNKHGSALQLCKQLCYQVIRSRREKYSSEWSAGDHWGAFTVNIFWGFSGEQIRAWKQVKRLYVDETHRGLTHINILIMDFL